jgi:hypothetical protein
LKGDPPNITKIPIHRNDLAGSEFWVYILYNSPYIIKTILVVCHPLQLDSKFIKETFRKDIVLINGLSILLLGEKAAAAA